MLNLDLSTLSSTSLMRSYLIPPVLQPASCPRRDASINALAMARPCLASIACSRVTPFSGTNISSPETLIANAARVLPAYRKALLGT